LLDRRGAKRVRRAEHHAAPFLPQPVGELADASSLAAPFTPTMKITRVPLPFCEAAIRFQTPSPAAWEHQNANNMRFNFALQLRASASA